MIFQESETVELKSIVVDDIKKEIIAFANCEGGKLYIGVQDDGTVIGVDDPDGAALQVSNMVRDAIKPDLTMFLHYQTLNEDGKQIIAIDVQQGTERPYNNTKKAGSQRTHVNEARVQKKSHDFRGHPTIYLVLSSTFVSSPSSSPSDLTSSASLYLTNRHAILIM